MRWFSRAIEKVVQEAARAFPAVVITGPRRVGKTTLLRRLFPEASYKLLEAPDVVAQVKSDARGFLESLDTRRPVILDEIQNTPELLPFLRAMMDERPSKRGRWLITGSQDFALMQGVTESMAGRAAVLSMLPLSSSETGRLELLRGGYPEVWARPSSASLWFDSYLQTFVERDVRSIRAVHDLPMFRRFIALTASRHGQLLNRSELAAPLGISVPTVNAWLGLLELTGQLVLVPPYFENFGKRLVKSPRMYWLDSGMACHLLGLREPDAVDVSPFKGPLFEGAVAAEILKAQVNAGRRRELYGFRDERGFEIDFVVPRSNGRVALVEVKSARTVTPSDALPLKKLEVPAGAERWVVYQGKERVTLGPGIIGVPMHRFIELLKT